MKKKNIKKNSLEEKRRIVKVSNQNENINWDNWIYIYIFIKVYFCCCCCKEGC